MPTLTRLLLVLACAGACGSDPAAIDAGPTDGTGMPDTLDAPPSTRLVAYVSGGADIAWYDVDRGTGALSPISSIAAFRTGASFLAMRGTSSLYAVTSGNRVGAYALDAATGGLTFINDVSAGGTGPTHVSVDGTGAFVFVANYGNGTISV